MAKYNELLGKYAEDIERIKDAKRQMEEARQKYDEFAASQTYENYDYATEAELSEAWGQASMAYNELSEYLNRDIDEEYFYVPFSKPRQQGIEKFFELAGI